MSIDTAVAQLRDLPYQDIGFAKIDHHRPLRTGWPEVVMGLGKTPDQISRIVSVLKEKGHPVLVTKTDALAYTAVLESTPEAVFNQVAHMIVVPAAEPPELIPGVTIVTAGTSDLPVAEEAAITAGLMGSAVVQIKDVGVAGLHRLLDQLPLLHQARVIVAVAGMDAALASVVTGLVSAPVISVPTSIGYGASFSGIAPLLSMLNSCAPGSAVVNIDNGFGAGYLAAQINRMPSAEAQGAASTIGEADVVSSG